MSKSENKRRETVIYLNSNDNTYSLKVFKSHYSFMAFLYDFKKLKIHKFNVNETINEGDIFFSFDYIKSDNLYHYDNKFYSNHVFKFQNLESNDSIKKVNLKILKNSKKKNSVLEYNLEMINNNVNLFHAFRICCIHPYELIDNQTYENGIVVYGIGKTISGLTIEHKLEELKEIEFTLEVPITKN